MYFKFFIPNKETTGIFEAEQKIIDGDLEGAITSLENFSQNYPYNREISLLLGELYLNGGRWSKAAEIGRKLFNKEEQDPRVYYILGCALGRLGRFHQAYELLEEADRLEPENSEILRNMGWIKSMMHDIEAGKKILLKSIALDPQNISSYVDLAMIHAFRANYAKALGYIEQALHIDPENDFATAQKKNIERFKVEYEKMSDLEKSRYIKEVDNPLYAKEINLNFLLSPIKDKNIKQEDVWEIEEELKRTISGGITQEVIDLKSDQGKIGLEYFKMHKSLKNRFSQKLPKKEIKKIIDELETNDLKKEKRKELILILAHQGNLQVFESLRNFYNKANGEDKVWLEMALNECKAFLKSDIMDEPKLIIRKILGG